jgi:hypothetical protein
MSPKLRVARVEVWGASISYRHRESSSVIARDGVKIGLGNDADVALVAAARDERNRITLTGLRAHALNSDAGQVVKEVV